MNKKHEFINTHSIRHGKGVHIAQGCRAETYYSKVMPIKCFGWKRETRRGWESLIKISALRNIHTAIPVMTDTVYADS